MHHILALNIIMHGKYITGISSYHTERKTIYNVIKETINAFRKLRVGALYVQLMITIITILPTITFIRIYHHFGKCSTIEQLLNHMNLV